MFTYDERKLILIVIIEMFKIQSKDERYRKEQNNINSINKYFDYENQATLLRNKMDRERRCFRNIYFYYRYFKCNKMILTHKYNIDNNVISSQQNHSTGHHTKLLNGGNSNFFMALTFYQSMHVYIMINLP